MKASPSQVNTKGRKRRVRLILFFVLCFFIWTGYTAYLQSAVLAEKEQQLIALRQEEAMTKLTQQDLNYKVNRLGDKEYIAELARKDYFMSKKGEIIFVIPDK